MLRKTLVVAALVAAAGQAFAVDEVALKATTPNAPRTVLQPLNAVSYSDTNVGGVSWDRPFADGTCCSGLGPVLLSAQEFSLSAGDTCDVGSVQNGFDGYLFVYANSFDPLNQTANFVAGDDDGNGGIGTSDINGVALNGGTTYIAVTTGFAAGDEGTFTNTINCPTATVTLGAFVAAAPPVPAPTMGAGGLAILALAFGLIGMAVVRTRN